MFTLEEIKKAHGKVKSGADFPAYIQDMKALGVTSYEMYVTDGHTNYSGGSRYRIASAARYNALTIDDHTDPKKFKAALAAHQQGKTDYTRFCMDCARSGIEKWIVFMDKMTCNYYDKKGNEILAEKIPQ